LLVMAAGIGSRYGGLKQIDPVGPNGEIIIDYSIYDAIRAGFGKVVFVIRRDIEQAFREKVGRTIESQIDTRYVFQQLDAALPEGFTPPADRVKPWGTGHAVLCAADEIDEPFCVINADDFYGRGTFATMGEYLRTAGDGERYDYSMVGFILANTLTDHGYVSRGVCEIADGHLQTVVERTRIERTADGARYSDDGGETWQTIDPASIVSMNFWGFTPSLFGELRTRFAAFLGEHGQQLKAEFFIPTVVNELIHADQATVTVLRSAEQWLGVTYPQDAPAVKAAIAARIAAGEYPSPLWAQPPTN
jgi:hypothetical protein